MNLNSATPKNQQQKPYNSIWAKNPDGFGPPSQDILTYCHHHQKQDTQAKIVDVGSGNGRYAIAFGKATYQSVTAVEISQNGCNLIKQRQEMECPGRIQIHKENVLTWNPNKQFDIVVSSGLIEEFRNQSEQIKATQNLQAATNPEGRLVLRYCLYISERTPPQRVENGIIRSLFDDCAWNVVHYSTDSAPFFNTKSTINDGQNTIQRQTIVADKKHISLH